MLRDCTIQLIREGYRVTVIGRDATKLQSIIDATGQQSRHAEVIQQDYTQENNLLQKINQSVQKHGPFDHFICWMHSHADSIRERLFDHLINWDHSISILHIKGSAYYHPAMLASEKNHPNVHSVYLGFKIDNGVSRWLHDHEIAQGVWNAFSANKREFTVGQIEPWSSKP